LSLSGAAAALGLPEALVQRSAEARAAESGQSVDDILAAWAGGDAAPSAAAEGDEVAAPEVDAATTREAAAAEQAATPEEVAPEPPVIPTPEPAAAPAPGAPATAPTRKPVPAEVTAAEAAHLPEVVTVPTAGIKERTNFVIPRWLTALMLFVPVFALFALGGSATGACGEATELAADVISGEIVNCDGSEFTGGGAGGGATDFIALGEQIYSGNAVTGVNCAGCHGANGQGSGAFPALTGVLTTFGECADHEMWVTLGSTGWQSQVGPTYGDTNKTSGGGMPAFGGTLSQEQLAAVVSFERVRFGGQNPDEALVDCGLVESEDEAGEGEGTPEGEDGTTETTVPVEGGDTQASG
jgi:mono/diheme cytochrome c family protein